MWRWWIDHWTAVSFLRLVLRIRCDAKVAQCPLGEKFGCDPFVDAPALIQLAKSMNLNVRDELKQRVADFILTNSIIQQLIGISFHVGSGCQDVPIYAEAICAARKLFDFAESVGYNFHLLDIGGGFPGDKNTDIRPVCSETKKLFCQFEQMNWPLLLHRSRRLWIAVWRRILLRPMSLWSQSLAVTSFRLLIHWSHVFMLSVICIATAFFMMWCIISTTASTVHSIAISTIIIQRIRLPSIRLEFETIARIQWMPDKRNLLSKTKLIRHFMSFQKSDELFSSSVWGPTCDALDQVREHKTQTIQSKWDQIHRLLRLGMQKCHAARHERWRRAGVWEYGCLHHTDLQSIQRFSTTKSWILHRTKAIVSRTQIKFKLIRSKLITLFCRNFTGKT